jgi:hypothetical protein
MAWWATKRQQVTAHGLSPGALRKDEVVERASLARSWQAGLRMGQEHRLAALLG